MLDIASKKCENEVIQHIATLCGCDIVSGPWIAGGAARRLWFGEDFQEYDIDVFFANSASLFRTNEILIKEAGSQPHISNNAQTHTLSYKKQDYRVQCVSRDFYKSLEGLMHYFDLTVCKFATDGKIIVTNSASIRDCVDKRLRRNITTPQKISPFRIIKYGLYGFNADMDILRDLIENYLKDPTGFTIDKEYTG